MHLSKGLRTGLYPHCRGANQALLSVSRYLGWAQPFRDKYQQSVAPAQGPLLQSSQLDHDTQDDVMFAYRVPITPCLFHLTTCAIGQCCRLSRSHLSQPGPFPTRSQSAFLQRLSFDP